jgi:hypothetical protein
VLFVVVVVKFTGIFQAFDAKPLALSLVCVAKTFRQTTTNNKDKSETQVSEGRTVTTFRLT